MEIATKLYMAPVVEEQLPEAVISEIRKEPLAVKPEAVKVEMPDQVAQKVLTELQIRELEAVVRQIM